LSSNDFPTECKKYITAQLRMPYITLVEGIQNRILLRDTKINYLANCGILREVCSFISYS
jgi:hypothetical protein